MMIIAHAVRPVPQRATAVMGFLNGKYAPSTRVASQKSHFQPSVEMGIKSVDENIDKNNKQ